LKPCSLKANENTKVSKACSNRNTCPGKVQFFYFFRSFTLVPIQCPSARAKCTNCETLRACPAVGLASWRLNFWWTQHFLWSQPISAAATREVDYEQNMGRITLKYVFPEEAAPVSNMREKRQWVISSLLGTSWKFKPATRLNIAMYRYLNIAIPCWKWREDFKGWFVLHIIWHIFHWNPKD
jgi:hypothetical protein